MCIRDSCKQKAFKLKEDLRIFTDDTCATELLRISTQQILDIEATYSVAVPTGESLGSLRRKGLKSILRDEWLVFAHSGEQIGTILEDSQWKATVRRIIELAKVLMPQSFTLRRTDGREIATFRQHFNPFIYRLGVSIVHAPDTVQDAFDDLFILAAGSLIAAIEGRQG